jgi:hypothetical protein
VLDLRVMSYLMSAGATCTAALCCLLVVGVLQAPQGMTHHMWGQDEALPMSAYVICQMLVRHQTTPTDPPSAHLLLLLLLLLLLPASTAYPAGPGPAAAAGQSCTGHVTRCGRCRPGGQRARAAAIHASHAAEM